MIHLLGAIKTLSPLHCGVGTGMNDIDLPVARHKVSGHPLIPGSSIKGVLKDAFRNDADDRIEALFGADNPDGNDKKAFASAISMGDALLLALPVRSFYGTFAYLVSPYTLQQFKAALARVMPSLKVPEIPTHLGLKEKNDSYRVMLTTDTLLKSPNADMILLEELDLAIDKKKADDWAKIIADLYCVNDEDKTLFAKRFAIADDNALNFLSETGLPVDARIAIDSKTGTVKQGALWYEETVPPETLMYSLIGVDRSFSPDVQQGAEELAAVLISEGKRRELFAQMGGKSTTGKGFVSVSFVKGV
ncbi:CRISPR-associated Cmr4 family protein [Desulfobotulus alkaliphilus]|uniref:CRISPR-associated Cmr4 family protein n=1 Tax=Desulfobotulus alkaliphilus TaxID=622671 RepID=A0A562R3C0_9BACT|nr:type III-B CRISPR module RAMP protein Cmr4 [Desulfobotulus alkaliphilus]TWI62866.1 CRISPR-associated Cmr4 family protein [Desulfobotulus alkaliphilus]